MLDLISKIYRVKICLEMPTMRRFGSKLIIRDEACEEIIVFVLPPTCVSFGWWIDTWTLQHGGGTAQFGMRNGWKDSAGVCKC